MIRRNGHTHIIEKYMSEIFWLCKTFFAGELTLRGKYGVTKYPNGATIPPLHTPFTVEFF